VNNRIFNAIRLFTARIKLIAQIAQIKCLNYLIFKEFTEGQKRGMQNFLRAPKIPPEQHAPNAI